ncbi:mycofactocin-coupled SDR family oxidoreductase [Halorussus caseinilyticus]|uniref:mycofactocin-coupled SDR family oxidoreductase n=1 Tax=Halorussus caseinilyticus TaxID=3034025 RepID=UPI0023E761B3|nr:mycofactocin-coupled SDR family oxidoreductase [Halorussus sp. DT72]
MAEYDFDGRVAFVTGGARGQGRSHALRYAENGADVACADICETTDESAYELGDETELDETVRKVEDRGQSALGVQMDVADEREVEAGVERAVSEFGRIDFLANNAGVAPVSGLMELDEQTWDHALDVNLKGRWLCAKHVGQHMIDRGEGGRIVNTPSTAGMVASPGLGHYTAAKHGVLGLTKTLAMELAPHDVTVNAVCPTAVDTPTTGGIVESIGEEMAEVAEQSGPDNVLGEIVQPEDVSAAFVWLSSDDARFVTGIALPVAAGATAI